MKARIQPTNLEKIQDKYSAMLPMWDVADQFFALISLPDEKFDEIYEDVRKDFFKVFDSETFQQELIKTIDFIPQSANELDKDEDYLELIKEIEEDDSLSKNKKDMLITTLQKWIGTIGKLARTRRIEVNVKVEKLNENAKLPTYAHDTDAGADVYAAEAIIIKPNETKLIKTGLKVAIPNGYEIQIRPRSGLSLKTGLRVANAPGTVDAQYRGEICVIMTNISTAAENINIGDRIAQMVISPVPMIKWIEEEIVDETDRGSGGFGSTDSKSWFQWVQELK